LLSADDSISMQSLTAQLLSVYSQLHISATIASSNQAVYKRCFDKLSSA